MTILMKFEIKLADSAIAANRN